MSKYCDELYKDGVKYDQTQVNMDITKEPTGFTGANKATVNYSDVIINGDSSTRTVTLTGTFEAYYKGTKVTELVSGYTSPAHGADVNEQYFLMYDGSTIEWKLVSALNLNILYENLLIVLAFYDGINSVWRYVRESHGIMQHEVHKEFHENIGTYRQSGGGITGIILNSTTATDRRPDVAATELWDEDSQTINPELLETDVNYTQAHLSGTNSSEFYTGNADIVPLSGNHPYWNEFTGGTWQQSLMAQNSYMSIWVVALPACEDSSSQEIRYLWWQGQSNTTTLAGQRVLSPSSIDFGDLSLLAPEYVVTNQVIIEFRGGNWDVVEVKPWTGSRAQQTGVSGSTGLTAVSTDATLEGLGTTTIPLSINEANPNTWTGLQSFSGGIKTNSIDSINGLGISVNDDLELGSYSLTAEQITSTDDMNLAGTLTNTMGVSDIIGLVIDQLNYTGGSGLTLAGMTGVQNSSASNTGINAQGLSHTISNEHIINDIPFAPLGASQDTSGIINRVESIGEHTATVSFLTLQENTKGITNEVKVGGLGGSPRTITAGGAGTVIIEGIGMQNTVDGQLFTYNKSGGTCNLNAYGSQINIDISDAIATNGTLVPKLYGNYVTLRGTLDETDTGYGYYFASSTNITNSYAFYNGDINCADNFMGCNGSRTYLGTNNASYISYDGSNFIIEPDAVGSGIVLIGATGDDDMKLNNIEIDGALNHDGTTIGFFGVTPTTRQTELTDELTTITHTGPTTPDYAIATPINTNAWGFSTQDEFETVMSVIANLQTRNKELENKLVAYGLLQDAD